MAVNFKNYALAMFIAPNGELDGVWEYNLPEEKELLASDFADATGQGYEVFIYENPQPTKEGKKKKVEGYFIDAFGQARTSADGEPTEL
jgi:hypothetical protein